MKATVAEASGLKRWPSSPCWRPDRFCASFLWGNEMVMTKERLAEAKQLCGSYRAGGHRNMPALIDELIAEVERLQAHEAAAVAEERERCSKAVQASFLAPSGCCYSCKWGEPHINGCRALEAIRAIEIPGYKTIAENVVPGAESRPGL